MIRTDADTTTFAQQWADALFAAEYEPLAVPFRASRPLRAPTAGGARPHVRRTLGDRRPRAAG